MTQQIQIISGAKIFDGENFLTNHILILEGEKILKIVKNSEFDLKKYPNATQKQFAGGIITAGFIDIQVNGGNGVLLNDAPNVEGIKAIISGHRKYGTTAMLPTLISDTSLKMQQAVDAANLALEQNVAGIVGLHLEGPYFNLERKGVHQVKMIRQVDDGAFELYKNFKGGVLMVTLAPEKAPKGFIKKLRDAGILVYAGHSAANYEQTKQALAEGLSGFTHLYNAMPPMLSRDPGIVGAAIEDDNTFMGIILDDVHVSRAAAKIAIKAKKRGKTCIITDAMPPVGSDDPSFELYGETITVKDGYCMSKGGSLAGCALDMATAMRNCHKMLGFSLEESLRMASIYPATALGLEKHIGLVVQDYQADLVHLNNELMVTDTAIKGQWENHI